MNEVKSVGSEREQMQERLINWLETWTTAPYGVIGGMFTPESKRGKARTITFGLAGTLDATVTIWSVARLELKSSRASDTLVFKHESEFTQFCVEAFGAPAVSE